MTTNPAAKPERSRLSAILQEAIAIQEAMWEQPSYQLIERAVAHHSVLMFALEHKAEDERWARAALMLSLSLKAEDREVELVSYLRRARAVAGSDPTRRRIDLDLAQALAIFGQKEASTAILARLEDHVGDELWDVHLLKAKARLMLSQRDFDALLKLSEYAFHFCMERAWFYWACHFSYYRAFVHIRREDYEKAIALTLEGLELCRIFLPEDHYTAWSFKLHLADIHTQLGQHHKALTYTKSCYDMAVQFKWNVRLPTACSVYASALIMAGRFDEAKALLDRHGWDDHVLSPIERMIYLILDTVAAGLTGQLSQEEFTRRALTFGEMKHDAYQAITLMIAHAIGPRRPEGFPDYVPHYSVSRQVWETLRERVLHQAKRTAELPCLKELNGLERALLDATLPTLRVVGEFERVAVGDQGPWVDLSRRHVLRRMLRALADDAPDPVDAWALFEATWPNKKAEDFSALNRLYTTLHRARELGLEKVLETVDDGYRLAAALRFEELETR